MKKLLTLLLCLTATLTAFAAPLNIYPLGDSITWGFYNGQNTGGYRTPLYFKLADAGYSTLYVGTSEENPGPEPADQHHHDGHPSFRSDEINGDLDGVVSGSPPGNNGGYWLTGISGTRAPITPDIVLMHVGSNDVFQGQSGAAPGRVNQMLTKIENLRPNAHIFVALIIPIDNISLRTQVADYNTALRTVIQQHISNGKKVHLVDLYSRFVNADGSVKPGLLYDGAHCTQAGHNLMADGWFEAIQAVFSPQNPPPTLGTPTLAYYRFEGTTNGSTVYASNANHTIADSSANNFTMNTPALEASPSYGTDLPFTTVPQTSASNARSLNNSAVPGNGYNVRFVRAPAGSRLNTLALTSFTIEASFKLSALGGFQTIVGKDRTDANILADLYFQVIPPNGNGQSFFKALVKQPTRDTVEVVGTTPIQANRWYNVALTVDGSQMVVFLHDTVTGGRTFEGSAACSGLYQGNSSWTIGCGQFNGGTVDHMSGQIDEVRFSNAALPYGSLLQATPGTTGPVITARSMSAFERVPETTAEGYQVLYSLDLPVNAGWQGSNTIPYLVNNAASQGSFDRVAYYLELINGANVQWVYASMDAFTNSPQQLGIPHSSFNPVKFQQSVINMNVWSNVAGIVTGQSLDGGAIEMWPSNSDTGRGGLFYAGDGGTYDWDDANGTTAAGYGSFHISNPIARQMLFSYNHWGASDGAADDIGIGNASSGNPNYTFAANTGSYTSRKLVILVRPTSNNSKLPAATFTSVPANSAVVPRTVATNQATVPITGEVTSASISTGGINKVVLRVSRNGTQLSQTLVNVDASNRTFSFSPQITAELASYNFDILLSRPAGLGTEEVLVRRVTYVVAGDVYIFYGQSNAEAPIQYSNPNTTSNGYAGPWVRTFGQNADSGDATRHNLSWVPANGDGAGSTYVDPGAVGQWAIVIGGRIVADYGIPVALLNGARGGYSIELLQKDDAQPNNLDDSGGVSRTYNRLRFRALQAGVAAKARALFYYQGEFDNNDAPRHAAGFDALHADWQVDYPGLEHIYEVQLHDGCFVTHENVALREAQRNFANVYPNLSVMATNGIQGHDGCHYFFTNGYEVLGLHHFRQMARDLYGGPNGPNIDALNPSTVFFTNATRTAIRVTMTDPGATISFPSGAVADFALTGTSVTITGRSVSGNSILLNLSAPATDGVGLEYRGHSGSGAFVTNANGVGLLSFIEPVVSTPFNLWLESYFGPSGVATADPKNDGLSALTEYGLGLNPTQNNAGSPRLPQVVRNGTAIQVAYQRATDHPDALVELQTSPDLATWTTVSDVSAGVNGNIETRSYAVQVGPATPRLFFHLRISVP